MAREPRSLLEQCVAGGGAMKGMRVATFIVQWAIAQSVLGPGMTLEQAARWWRENERTWYRRLKDFRSVYELRDPGPLVPAIMDAAPGLADLAEDVDRLAPSIAQGVTALGRVRPDGLILA